MGIRKNLLFMTTPELDAFFEALLKMKDHIVNPLAAAQDQFSVYDQFTSLHWAVFSVSLNQNFGFFNAGHQGPAFLSWHREYLRHFEAALQDEVPGVMLPYWDWSASVFTELLMGPDGGPNGVGGGEVLTGWFGYDKPGNGVNTTPLPGWYPPTLAGWRIRADLDDGPIGVRLERRMATPGADTLPSQADVNALLAITAANPNNAGQRQTAASNFRQALEAAGIAGVTSSHNEVHRFIDGHMGTAASPNDPIFWLHHCNIDRLWAMWQRDGHAGADWFPVLNSQGHRLNDAMWPWVGNTPYFMGTAVPTQYFPSFGNITRTAADVLDHRALGYAYDTEPILGVALDRSGSMNGASTDPFNGNGPTTKWALAKLGISHLLGDCEAAYAAREAYVVGGVHTFTTGGGGNEVIPAVANKPYGLVRAGANYPAAYPAADVDAALNATGPAAATPLGAALTVTYSEVVRPPANALPADDIRYLSFFTDGKETAGPMLNTIAAGQFADTYIFGMGFGSGTSWDGVDYATIQTIVSKGRTPPVDLNLTQVYEGETMGAIDKFYSNSLARVIGYTPLVDPRFELYPGEEIHLPFWTTSADEGIFITVLRGDADAARWHIALMAPDGARYHNSTTAPVFITMQHRGGRDTIFMRRNHATDAQWIGRWFVHISYRAHAPQGHSGGLPHGHVDDHAHTVVAGPAAAGMLMPSKWDQMIHAAAPPVVGPVFAQFDLSAAKRVSTRTMPQGRFPAIGAPVLGEPAVPSHMAVNIYTRTAMQVDLRLSSAAPYAGYPIEVVLALADPGGGTFSQVRALARLIAPGRSVSEAFRDTRTIPLDERKRFVIEDADGVRFDELRFLAEYERRRPGAFTPRDEKLSLVPKHAGLHYARIDDTKIAGMYRVGVHLEGTLERPGRKPERFLRVLSAELGLGVRVDPTRSRPEVRRTADGIAVTLTPQDRFGNMLSPSRAAATGLRIDGQPMEAKHEPQLDGSHNFVAKDKSDRALKTEPQRLGVDVGGQSFDISLRKPDPECTCDDPTHDHHHAPGDRHDHDHDDHDHGHDGGHSHDDDEAH